MGGMACIIPRRAAGVADNVLIPGRRSQRLVITCVIGAAGGPLGGWATTRLFLTVIAGVILLPACHPLTERPGHLAHR
jgi:uncharacterized membrane protein YeaQ/YmgE (transglycosylase-associated protein family)